MLPLKLMYLRTVIKIVRFLVQRPRFVFCCFASNSKQWSDRYIWCMAMCHTYFVYPLNFKTVSGGPCLSHGNGIC